MGDWLQALRRDGLFLCLLVQIAVYVFAAPMLVAQGNPSASAFYQGLQWRAAVFYVLPLVIVYGYVARRLVSTDSPAPAIRGAEGWRGWAFLAVAALIVGAYWVSVIDAGMVSRRQGSEIMALRFAGLRFGSLLVIKLHDVMVLPLGAVALSVWALKGWRQAWRWATRSPAGLGLSLCSFSALSYSVLNSRGTLLLMFVLAAGLTLACWQGSARLFVRAVLRLGLVAVLCMGALLTARAMLFSTQHGVAGAMQRAEWVDRLDCVSLMAQMEPGLRTDGFEDGAAWRYPIEAGLGWLVDPARVRQLKAEQMTTAKAYLLGKYTRIGLRDYPSCSLTDAYANFGAWGFVLAALLHALAFVGIAWVFRRHGAWSAAALLLAGTFLFFEHELIGQLLDILKNGPGLLLMLWLRPFELRESDADGI